MHIPGNVKKISALLAESGYQCFIVGGAVRDSIAGLRPQDFDLATDAHPETVIQLFRRTAPTGIEHGTVTILMDKEQYEITTFRTETTYTDSRHPDQVLYADNIEEDLSRRDFSMNALAWDIENKRIIDLYHGIDAIHEHRIEAIGAATERFNEDPLRILRACRFSAQLGFQIEAKTSLAAFKLAEKLALISHERIRDELSKLICAKYSTKGLFQLRELNILPYILPELEACTDIGQKGSHEFDVFEHSVYACEGSPGENLVLRLAALFHDIGKVPCRTVDENGIASFHNHETVGAELTEKIMLRLKFPKNLTRQVCHLVRQHMYNYTAEWSDAAVRRFIARVGEENIDDLFTLRKADSYAMNREPVNSALNKDLKKRIEREIAGKNALTLKELSVNGNDLAEAGIPKGPIMGVLLNQLLETVFDDPGMNKKNDLINLAINIFDTIKASED